MHKTKHTAWHWILSFLHTDVTATILPHEVQRCAGIKTIYLPLKYSNVLLLYTEYFVGNPCIVCCYLLTRIADNDRKITTNPHECDTKKKCKKIAEILFITIINMRWNCFGIYLKRFWFLCFVDSFALSVIAKRLCIV